MLRSFLFQLFHLLVLAELAEFPHVGFHSHTVVLVLSQVGEPELDGLGVAVLDLYQSPERDSLKIFLRLLEDEVTPGHSPSLRDARKRNRT